MKKPCKFLKSLEEMTLLDWLVALVVVTQLILIIILMFNVCSVSEATRRSLDPGVSNERVYADAQTVPDSLQVVAPIPEEKVVRSNAIADNSPTIISIILTLITLCVTLSVVIPYVEGKAMTEGKVRTVAREYYQDAFESVQRFYDETLEDSLWEDAHASRMTAYFLQKSEDPDDKVWAIGFASKAILRYVKLIHQKPDRYGHNAYHEIDFIKRCLDYMGNEKSSFDGVDSGKMLRAFSDLSFAAFLASGFDFRSDLKSRMAIMYPHLKEKVSLDDIDVVLNKHNRSNDEEVMEKFREWMNAWIKEQAGSTRA